MQGRGALVVYNFVLKFCTDIRITQAIYLLPVIF